MPTSRERPDVEPLPAWAVDQATIELGDMEDQGLIAQHAREIVSDEAQRDDERHDEFDDPDQGGEA